MGRANVRQELYEEHDPSLRDKLTPEDAHQYSLPSVGKRVVDYTAEAPHEPDQEVLHEESSFLSNFVFIIQNALKSHSDLNALSIVRKKILEGRDILQLKTDWDDDGSPDFSPAHWDRIEIFLLGALKMIWEKERRVMVAPTINAVSGGTIDVHWKTQMSELLINVPRDLTKPATFYGDNFSDQSIKGTLCLTTKDYWLLLWLGLAK